jgi:glyoxalase family protein
VTLSERSAEVAENVLTNLLGFKKTAEGDGRTRYLSAGSGGSFADVVAVPEGAVGQTAVGTVHHVAWRAPDEETQETWREELEGPRPPRHPHPRPQLLPFDLLPRARRGPLRDRHRPARLRRGRGPDHLGENLKLPPWLEKDREHIEEVLPPVHLPHEEG